MNGMQRDNLLIDNTTSTNTLDFYKALAKELEEKSRKGRWDVIDVFELEIQGKNYTIGPFVEVEATWERLTGFSFKNDTFAVVAGDSFDSWGYEEGYAPFVSWKVMKIASYVPVYEDIEGEY